MTTLVLTITETLRYTGKIGQLSWALHRISGLGVLFFFILHVVDTSWAVFYPDLYAKAIAVYQSPLFTLGEFALVACVIYHALNGFRISLIDRNPKWWKYQDRAATWVLIATIALIIPVFIGMAYHVVVHYQNPETRFDLKLVEVIESQLPFLLGIAAVFIGGLVVSGAAALVAPGEAKKSYKRSGFDTFMWSFMRISGILIIPLVFGHLAMMHIIQGVFDITRAGHVAVGTDLINQTGSAAEFVAHRWNYAVFGAVFVWRIYDALLLTLVAIHAFNGLRYVVNDYIHNHVINRAARLAILVGAVIIIVVGSAALIATTPATAAKIENTPAQVITQAKP